MNKIGITVCLIVFSGFTCSFATNKSNAVSTNNMPTFTAWQFWEGKAADPFLGKKATPGYYSHYTFGGTLNYYPRSRTLNIVVFPKYSNARLPIRFGVYYKSTGKLDAHNNPITTKQPDLTKTVYAANSGNGRVFNIKDPQLINILNSKKSAAIRFSYTLPGHKPTVGSFPNFAAEKDRRDAVDKTQIDEDYDAKTIYEDSLIEDTFGLVEFYAPVDTVENGKSDAKDSNVFTKDSDGVVFSYVEEMPTFPGGRAALNKFISEHLKYPERSLENGVQGKVIVRFVVNEDGSVGEVKILKSLDIYCDREAMRVVKMLPRFQPGLQQGKPVKVWFQLPITFRADY